MEDEAQVKILQLLDVISVEVAANRADTAALGTELRAELHGEIGGLHGEIGGLRQEMRSGFDRVDRRLGHLENRIENLEAGVSGVGSELRDFRGEFERRIAPLEL
jgi:hypothetical protein